MNTMIPMTDAARQFLEAWFLRQEPAWIADGADPAEVRSDMLADLRERFARHPGPVDEPELRVVMDSMAPDPVLPRAPGAADVRGTGGSDPWHQRAAASTAGLSLRLFRLLVPTDPRFLAVWPLLVFGFELVFPICGGMFFDPLPSGSHIALVGGAIATGLLCLHHRRLRLKGPVAPLPGWLAVLRGTSLVISGYWSLLLLPLLLAGPVLYLYGVVMSYGIGLVFLPFFLLAAWAAAAPMFLWFEMKRTVGAGRLASRLGIAAGLLLLTAVEGPGYISRFSSAHQSIGLQRRFGSELTLLRMCYEGTGFRRSMTDTTGFVSNLGRGKLGTDDGTNAEQSRTLYYKVTGKAFNSLPPPTELFAGMGSDNPFGDFVWDPDLGGDGVFARIRGLYLASSRLDGHVDAASGLGYWEWTMDFKNNTSVAQEARMQILLPPGGVVSRLTLWVNGSPQEAAFAGGAKVAGAYKEVAVAQRRDPVLARWVGPDRVLVQCYPVPIHGDMKIRVGITAPLDDQHRLFFPRFIEQNFGFSAALSTALWVQGDTALKVDGLKTGSSSGEWREVHGRLPIAAQAARHACVSCDPVASPPVLWTRDRFAPKGQEILVRAETAAPPNKGATKIVLAVDSSAPMHPWRQAIADAAAKLQADGVLAEIVVAMDNAACTSEADGIAQMDFTGGRDNRLALQLAIMQANEKAATTVVWLHGPQPVKFGDCAEVLQLLERGFSPPRLVCLDLVGGPNRILEEISSRIQPTGTGRVLDPADLQARLSALVRGTDRKFEYTRHADGQQPENGKEVWDQLARWQAWDTVRNAAPDFSRPETASLAARYQLVTPVSGAVVLETKDQYQRHGLDPIDPNSAPRIPSVPEPSTPLLIGLGAILALRRRRPQARLARAKHDAGFPCARPAPENRCGRTKVPERGSARRA